jgi:hypothetical protein
VKITRSNKPFVRTCLQGTREVSARLLIINNIQALHTAVLDKGKLLQRYFPSSFEEFGVFQLLRLQINVGVIGLSFF